MLTKSAQKVQERLKSLGFKNKVIEIPESTRTAAEAAEAVGCKVGQIVKSLVFKTKRSGEPLLIVVSGKNRVDEEILKEHLSEEIKIADADYVKEHTGFVIGGVPPIGHIQKMKTFIDEDLLEYDEIWAAAGNANAVFMLTADELVKMTGGLVISVK